MNRLLACSNYGIYLWETRVWRERGWIRAITCICHHYGLRLYCCKRRRAFGFIISSLREAFVVDLELVLWSTRVVVYVRSLPACLSLLCCGPLLLFGSSSTITFQVNTGVLAVLDSVEAICLVTTPILLKPLTQTLCLYTLLLPLSQFYLISTL